MSTSKEALEKARWTSDVTGVDVSALLVPMQAVLRKPVIVWDDPDPCAYVDGGVVLDGTHLNAVVTPGASAVVYQPAKGAKLGPGTHQLTATVAANERFEGGSKRVTLVVRKSRVKIDWATPAPVTYVAGGHVLGEAQLNAKPSVPGCGLTYTPAKGGLLDSGVHDLSAEPSAKDKYEAAPAKVKLQVRQATPEIAWKEPTAVLASGTTPSFTLGDAQLNASLPKGGEGKLVYQPAKGAKLTVGSHLLMASLAESKNYEYVQRSVRLTVFDNAKKQEGYEALRGGGGFKSDPTLQPLLDDVQDKWDKDEGHLKTDAQRIMAAAQDMTGDELIEFMNQQVKDQSTQYMLNDTNANGNPRKYPNHMWILPNGLQVRYKPNGDMHVNPSGTNPVPMFCVEVRNPSQTGFGEDQDDVLTKISVDGELAPKGPNDTGVPSTITGSDDLISFKGGSTGATHLRCRASKLAQDIVCETSVSVPHGTPLTAELLRVRLQPGNGAITLTPASGTVLPVGKQQAVTIKAAATTRFDEATKQIKVDVVKAKPAIDWAQPDDMHFVPGGVVLGDAQLNATVVPPTAGPITYTPAKGSKLQPGTHVLTATVKASGNSEQVVASVEVVVLKGVARITWPKPQDAEAGDDGVVLGTDQLKAVAEPNHLPLIYTPAAGTRLPPGTHMLHVHTEGDASFKGATLQVPFTVRDKTR